MNPNPFFPHVPKNGDVKQIETAGAGQYRMGAGLCVQDVWSERITDRGQLGAVPPSHQCQPDPRSGQFVTLTTCESPAHARILTLPLSLY